MTKIWKFSLGPSRIRLGPNHAQGFVTGVLITVSFFLGFIFSTGFGMNECAQAAKRVTPEGEELKTLCARMPAAVKPPAELLPPPEFIETLPDSIEVDREGLASLEWKTVPEAKSYLVRVQDLNGKTVKTFRTAAKTFKLHNLPARRDLPITEFKVSLATINADGKPGQANEPKKLLVRKPVDLTAPTIKSIKVED